MESLELVLVFCGWNGREKFRMFVFVFVFKVSLLRERKKQ